MLKDTDFDSPEVHEAFQKMLMEIPWSKLEEIIKSKRSFRKEFQEKGHHYVSKNKKRAAEIIEKDSEKNLEKINCLFKKWYDNKPEYQYIPKPFSESLEYCELKENNKIEAGQLEKPDDDKFDELAVALSKEHGMYFLYFSPINFSDKQAKRLIELTEQDEGEKVHILRKIVFDRNEKIVDLKINEEYENEVENAKKEKDVLELKWSQTEKEIKKLLGELEQKDESIKGLKRQLQDLKEISGTRTYEIDSLKRKNQQLVNKANELEKLKKEGLAEFIASKREEIERELISVQQFLKENKDSLHNILKQIEQEKQNRDALVEINELKRKELFEYMDNGERWKKALYPHSKQERLSMDSCGLAFQKWDEEKTIIEIFSELKTLLDNSGLSTDEIIRFKQSLKQLAREKIYRTNTLEEINQVGRFFQVLGQSYCLVSVFTFKANKCNPGKIRGSNYFFRECTTKFIK